MSEGATQGGETRRRGENEWAKGRLGNTAGPWSCAFPSTSLLPPRPSSPRLRVSPPPVPASPLRPFGLPTAYCLTAYCLLFLFTIQDSRAKVSSMFTRLLIGLLLFILCDVCPVRGQSAPQQDYLFYVVCESADRIALIRFGPKGARVETLFETGSMPNDIDGPHGVVVSPDKQFYYVSLGHGRPFGSVWKYETATNHVLGSVTLGFFPATMDISSDGGLLYVVNFNLHGDMIPSSVSVVATQEMIEVARIPTCTMPHGSRINQQGTRQYSACMMDDMLVEIDTGSLKVSRHFLLTKGKETGMPGSPATHAMGAPANHKASADSGGHGMEPPKP